MNTQELNELMSQSAQDAIGYIREAHQCSVSLCQTDLPTIDIVLTKLALAHIEQPLTDPEMFTVCNILGAFVGELFKTTRGGEWFMDESLKDAPYVVLNYAGKSFPFASICYEKLINQPEVSLAKYYELAVGGATQ
ncbi:MAG: hypothetical protein ACI8WB_002634 [Phenylobacterium sp.]|jgi:hypothetical protein